MGQAEKVSLLLLAFVLALVLTGVIGNLLLIAMLWSFGLTYAVGGYWLFRLQGQSKVVPILAGVAVGAAVFALPWGIKADQDWIKLLLFSLPNTFLFIFLLIYTYLLSSRNWLGNELKPLLLRSGVLFILSVIFGTTFPVNTWAHRQVLWAFNQHNESLLHNLRMFDLLVQAEEYIKANNCDAAIEAANAARREGELWLEWKNEDGLQRLYVIGGVLDMQFEAYLCKGKAAYHAEDYREALHNFELVDAVLDDMIGMDSAQHASDKVWSWNRMADCYTKLFEFSKADSLYTLAIKRYLKDGGKYDKDLADLLVNVGISATAQGAINESNEALAKAAAAFEKQYKKEGDPNGLLIVYEHLVANLIRANNLKEANVYLHKGLRIVHKDSLQYYALQHYNGYLHLHSGKYKEAIPFLETAKQGYAASGTAATGDEATVRQGLFNAYMALAEYAKAEVYIKEALAIAKEVKGSNSILYHKLLKDEALLDYHLANYQAAKGKLEQVLLRYEAQWGGETNQLPEVLALLARVETELDNQTKAERNAARALAISKQFPVKNYGSDNSIKLNIAHVNVAYSNLALADSIYKGIIAEAMQYNNKMNIAEAQVGLALIYMQEGKYSEAKKQLDQSTSLINKAVGKEHPVLATLYYNRASLLLLQDDVAGAGQELDKAIKVTQAFFKPEHPNHGDNLVLQGDIMLKSKRIIQAEFLYRKAEDIYKQKYGETHRKRVSLSARMQEMNKAIRNHKLI